MLDRLSALQARHGKVLREYVIDILRVLATPNEHIRLKVLDIAAGLLSQNNVEEVVGVLKKELMKTQEESKGGTYSAGEGIAASNTAKSTSDSSASGSSAAAAKESNKYREKLVELVHLCAEKFPDIANHAAVVLMDFLSGKAALAIAEFVREIAHSFPRLRPVVVEKACQVLPDVTDSHAMAVLLWIVAQYSESDKEVAYGLSALFEALGRLPLTGPHDAPATEAAELEDKPAGPTVLADGTYASQAAVSDSASKLDDDNAPKLRKKLIKGEYFLACAYASALTKLALRCSTVCGPEDSRTKSAIVDVMLVLASILDLGRSEIVSKKLDQDSFERIVQCINALGNASSQVCDILRKSTIDLSEPALETYMQQRKEATGPSAADKAKEDEKQMNVPADTVLQIRQLHGMRSGMEGALQFDDDDDLRQATGAADEEAGLLMKPRVFQLSGSSDPVYVEAKVCMREYDVLLEMTLTNRTTSTLTNLTVELATLGDLKVVERPQTYTVGPEDTITVNCSIKVASTESSHIFGTVVYGVSGSAEKTVINLNDVMLDVVDYLRPDSCTTSDFRKYVLPTYWRASRAAEL